MQSGWGVGVVTSHDERENDDGLEDEYPKLAERRELTLPGCNKQSCTRSYALLKLC